MTQALGALMVTLMVFGVCWIAETVVSVTRSILDIRRLKREINEMTEGPARPPYIRIEEPVFVHDPALVEVVLVGTDRITGRKMAVRGIVNIN